jgi:hypothetical protein
MISRQGLCRAVLIGAAVALMAACVSAPVETPVKAKTWQPATNQRGVTVAEANLACRQAVAQSGYDTVVLQGTLVEVCMRGEGFEFK